MHAVLQGIIQNKRIAAAYLFIGPPASGKVEEADQFAKKLCGSLVDRLKIEPDGASIKIEQIRELQRLVRFGPAVGKYQVVIMAEADKMTPEAAASFLKTLEEPAAGVVFILLIEREDRLPKTIASRCQRILFSEEDKKWEPQAEWQDIYLGLKEIKRKSVKELFLFSERLKKEKERGEELLDNLINFTMEESQDLKMVRVFLEAAKNLKKRANFNLLFDVACLKLGER